MPKTKAPNQPSKKDNPSAGDQLRIERFNRMRDELAAQGYHPVECTISILRANLMAFVTAGPVALAVSVLFFCLYGMRGWSITPTGSLSFLLAFLLCIPIHEFLHGLAWHFFCKSGWKSIHFGVIWSALTPYCACQEALSAKAYLIGLLTPFAVLGLGVSAAALISGNLFLLLLAVFNILGAGGDTTIATLLPRHRRALLLDHPTACGFWAFEPPA